MKFWVALQIIGVIGVGSLTAAKLSGIEDPSKTVITVMTPVDIKGEDTSMGVRFQAKKRASSMIVSIDTQLLGIHVVLHSSSEGVTSLREVTITGNPSQISRIEQIQLQILHQRLLKLQTTDQNRLLDELVKTLGMVAFFLPIQTPLADWSVTFRLAPPPEKPLWNMICNKIGKKIQGSYTVGEKTIKSSAIVGLKKDKCAGRCGTGCFQIFQKKKSQYTQECFNHDLCHRQHGSLMGECGDEFWAAADGYRNAPDCPEPVKSKVVRF